MPPMPPGGGEPSGPMANGRGSFHPSVALRKTYVKLKTPYWRIGTCVRFFFGRTTVGSGEGERDRQSL